MRLFIIISIIFFIFTVFLGDFQTSVSNPFAAYLLFQFNIFKKYFLILIFIISAAFIFIFKQYPKNKNGTQSNILNSLIQLTSALFISVSIAFGILILIAIIELNMLAILLNINPKLLGVKTNTNDIYKAIQLNNRVPEIIASDKNSQKEVIAIARAAGGTNNFYGYKILTEIPNFLIIPIRKGTSNLLLIDNSLIVTGLNISDMQTISPLIGYLFIKKFFPSRDIRSFPKVSVMDEKEFLIYRQKDANEKNKKIDTEIKKMGSSINLITETIQADKNNIATSSSSQNDVLKQRDKEFNDCLSEGSYRLGVFYPDFTKEYCEEIINKWEIEFKLEENKGKSLADKLESNEKKLKEYKYYDSFFKALKKLSTVSNNNISSELGVFEPPNSIKIIFNNTSSNSIAYFFENLSHEYLHYASYTQGKRLDSSFFEEGLTEYFARQAINDSMQVNTNNGYPIQVKIIQELTNNIADIDLTDIYFTKDQLGLEKKLNLVYGDNFYSDNIILFESLMYASNSKQAIEIANNIMKKIEGRPFTEKDFFSTNSEINLSN